MILQFGVGGAVLPFVSMYLRDRGLDFPEISRIYMLASGALVLFPFLWGWLADRFVPLNRLFTVLNLVAGLALFALGSADRYGGLLLSYALFHAVFNPTLMLINALCFPHLHDPAAQFGRLRAWGSVGWILPALPIYLWLAFGAGQDLRFVVYLACGLAFAAAAGSLALPHTAPVAGSRAGPVGGEKPGYWACARRLLGQLDFLAVLLSFFLVAASFSIYAFYSSPHLEDLGMPRAWIGPVQCIGVVLEIALFRWRSRLVGRADYTAPILWGCGALLARQLLFATCGNLPILAGSYVLVGTVVVFYHIGVSILVDRLAAPQVRATAQTLLALCGSGLGPLFANWATGQLTAWRGPGLGPVFLFAAGLALLAGLVLWWRRGSLNAAAGSAGRNDPALAM